MFFSLDLLTICLATTMMSDYSSTLVIRDKKVSDDIDASRDIWAIKWATFIDHMDVDRNGKMDEYEYVNETAARVGAITSSIEKEEKIKAYLQDAWDKWWKSLMNDVNLESISADDFILTEGKTRKKMVDMNNLDVEMKWALTFFELVDADGNGFLNKKEHADFLKIFRTPYSPDIFSELDTNNDGALSKSEMVVKQLTFIMDNSMEGADFYGKTLQ